MNFITSIWKSLTQPTIFTLPAEPTKGPIMNFRNFTSKETYLASVSTWKQELARQFAELRRTKNAFKDLQRAFAKHGAYQYNWSSAQKEAYFKDYTPMEEMRSVISRCKRDIRDLLVERDWMRIEAGRQMAARLSK